jgi:catechol 2,3-dioxygenase-like lactoylglutathione lyase family enzyme
MKKSAKRIGELVLRTSNVAALTGFYTDVIGLELYASFGNNSFLKVAEDFDGHPQMLALFDKSKEFRGPHSIRPYEAIAGTGTLHHFAFAMEMKDFKLEVTRLHELGLEFEFEEYEQFGWRSIHFHDPDGNSVEFVCHDPILLDTVGNAHASNPESTEGI